MASGANDLHGHRRPSSKRKSPFEGERTAGSASPYRFPKIEPLPNVADVSYDGEDFDPAHGSIIQVEEELERLVETVRTLGSDSGNVHAELGLDEYEDEEEEKKTYSLKAHSTDIRSRRRRSSLMEKGSSHDQVSSLLVEPGRKLHEPLRTTIIRILCWQLLLSTILSLPCLLIADFSESTISFFFHFCFEFRGIWLVYVSSFSNFCFCFWLQRFARSQNNPFETLFIVKLYGIKSRKY